VHFKIKSNKRDILTHQLLCFSYYLPFMNSSKNEKLLSFIILLAIKFVVSFMSKRLWQSKKAVVL